MTPEEEAAVNVLDEINGGDAETGHGEADEALLAFLDAVHPDVSAAWRRVQDRYHGFWYA